MPPDDGALRGAASGALSAAETEVLRSTAGAFIGMGMASMFGGMNASNLFQMGSAHTPGVPGTAIPGAAPGAAGPADWTCTCGKQNNGKFCPDCGKAK